MNFLSNTRALVAQSNVLSAIALKNAVKKIESELIAQISILESLRDSLYTSSATVTATNKDLTDLYNQKKEVAKLKATI